MTGTIKKLTDKFFGFIAQEDSDKDLFFHASNLVDVDINALQEGDKVEFDIVDTPRGQAAEQVKKI